MTLMDMAILRRLTRAPGLAAMVAACAVQDEAAPAPPIMAIAKTEAQSGDKQVGVAGQPLDQSLRVVVTQDNLPAPGVAVYWRTSEGTIMPRSDVTDAVGVSSARWRLAAFYAQQAVVASLDSAGPAGVVFTAIATPDPVARTTILVGPDGNRFDPAELTVEVGETVNWYWPPGSGGHNVVPDNSDSPPHSGPPAGFPKYHSYQFTVPGVFRYYCQVHGAPSGVGMSGTIIVVEPCGTSCME